MTLPTSLRPPARLTIHDRRILFLMAVAGLVIGYSGGLLSQTLPFARKTLGATEGDMSLVFAVTRAVSLLALALSAWGDRAGRRRPFLIALFLLVAGNLATVFAPGLVGFAALQSVTRVGVIGASALAVVVLAEELHPRVRGYGLGIWGLAGSMGTGAGLILLPIARSSESGWRVLFGLSGLGFLALLLVARFLTETRAFTSGVRTVRFGAALRSGLGRHFWSLAAIAFFVAAFASPAFDFALERLINDLEWETAAASFLLIVFSGVGTVGLLVGGRMSDVAGRRPTTVLAIMLGLIGGLGFYGFSSGWIMAPAIFLATFGATMLTPAFAAHRTELFPTRIRATAGAWITNAAIVGSIGGFLAGWLLVDRIGLPQTITVLGAGLFLAVLAALSLPETMGRELIGEDVRGATTPASQP